MLGRGPAVQRDGGHALVDGDAAGVQVGQVVVVDALAHLHRDRQAARVSDGGAEDGAQQRALVGQRGAAAAPGDLGDGAAEVEVDVVGQALVGDHADGPADGLRVDAVQLDGTGLLRGVEVDQPHGLVVPLDQGPAGDHLADEQPPAPAELPAERAERRVGDTRHGGEHHGRVHGVRADLERWYGRGHGIHCPPSAPGRRARAHRGRSAGACR